MTKAYIFATPGLILAAAPLNLKSLLLCISFVVILVILIVAVFLYSKIKESYNLFKKHGLKQQDHRLNDHIKTMNSDQIAAILHYLTKMNEGRSKITKSRLLGLGVFIFLTCYSSHGFSQTTKINDIIWTEGGIVIT